MFKKSFENIDHIRKESKKSKNLKVRKDIRQMD